jgi:hypothetical protein
MRAYPCLTTLVLSVVIGMTAASAQVPTRESVIEASNAFMRAYGSGNQAQARFLAKFADPHALGTDNHEALIEQFDENASFAGTLQPFWLRGKAQISDLWARYFARYSDRRLIFRDRDIQLHDNVSIETGYAEMYMGADPMTSVTTFMRYSITRVHRGGTWKIVNMMVDRLPGEQPPPGTMPAWANAPARSQVASPTQVLDTRSSR